MSTFPAIEEPKALGNGDYEVRMFNLSTTWLMTPTVVARAQEIRQALIEKGIVPSVVTSAALLSIGALLVQEIRQLQNIKPKGRPS